MSRVDLTECLISSKSYSEFLQKAYDTLHLANPRFNYSWIAKKAGFSARSYPRAVILGKKPMTVTALTKFTRAFGLKGSQKNYFELLVAQEEVNRTGDTEALERIQKKMQKLKSHFQSPVGLNAKQAADDLYKMGDWFTIYATLDSENPGTSLEQISKKTRLSIKTCEAALEQMIERGLAKAGTQPKMFRSCALHLVFDDLGSNQFFKQNFINTLKDIQNNAKINFEEKDRLFLNSIFSVKESRLPELRRELREILLKFVDSSEDSRGERIAKLGVGFYPI